MLNGILALQQPHHFEAEGWLFNHHYANKKE